MTVSELARLAGVTADTVRHYTRSGLLAPIRDESNGYIHGDRNRSERIGVGEARSAGAGVYMSVHEDAEHRATPTTIRAVDICRYV